MSTANASDDDDRTASSSVASFSRVPTIPARRRLPHHRFHVVSSHLIRSSRRATTTTTRTRRTTTTTPTRRRLHRRRISRPTRTTRPPNRPNRPMTVQTASSPKSISLPTTHSRRVTIRENTPGPRSRPICNPTAFGRSIRSFVVTRRTRARERRRPTESRAGRFFLVRSFGRSGGPARRRAREKVDATSRRGDWSDRDEAPLVRRRR